MIETQMLDKLKELLQTGIEDISFQDNTYYDETFFAKSIENDFTGWYDANLLERQLDLILKCCQVPPSSKVLDVACGHGRHAEILGQRGYEVLGTDISDRLIAYLNKKYGDKRISFEKRTFMELNYPGVFDLVIIIGNSLGLIPRDELPIVLDTLRNALKNGGWLFIEMDNRSHFVRNYAGKRFWNYYTDRWLVLSECYYDSENGLEKNRDISIDLADMRVSQFTLTKSLYEHDELSNLLEGADFIVRESFGDWAGGRVSEDSSSLLIAAQKA